MLCWARHESQVDSCAFAPALFCCTTLPSAEIAALSFDPPYPARRGVQETSYSGSGPTLRLAVQSYPVVRFLALLAARADASRACRPAASAADAQSLTRACFDGSLATGRHSYLGAAQAPSKTAQKKHAARTLVTVVNAGLAVIVTPKLVRPARVRPRRCSPSRQQCGCDQ